MNPAEKSLANTVLSGAAVFVALRLLIKALGIISTMVLARLLTKEDFGLVAMVMSAYALIEVFKAFGFDTVLIQRQDADAGLYNSAWTLQVFTGVLAAAALYFSSEFIASRFHEARLAQVAQYVALMFLLNGLVNIGIVNFRKNLQYTREFTFLLSTKLISVGMTIFLAFYLRNYWALVYGMLFNCVVQLGLSYVMSDFRPRLSLQRVKSIMGFSGWLVLSNLFEFINTRSKDLIIGKYLGVSSVGLISISDEISSLPTTELVASVNRASYPGYARVSGNNIELKALFLRVINISSSLGIPATVGLAILAPLLVPLLLGHKWIDAIPVIQGLAFSYVLMGLGSNLAYIYLAKGRPRVLLMMNATRAVLFLSLLFLFIDSFREMGFVYAMQISSALILPLHLFVIRRVMALRFLEYMGAVWRPILSSIIMAVVLYLLVVSEVPSPDYPLMALIIDVGIAIALGILSYGLSLTVIWLASGRPEGAEKALFNWLVTRDFFIRNSASSQE